jgi:transcriptional regulator with XRE-family HTH domain
VWSVRSGSLIRRRQLARILRELRQKAGMTIEVAAPLLDFSPSKLSRIENAHQGVDVHAVRSMMDIFGVGGERWGEIIELTREANAKGWWRAYGLDDQGYLPLEAEASTVRDFTVGFVPGLLQTPDYAREVFVSSLRRHTKATLDRDVMVRIIRQERLASSVDPLELQAVVEEGVLQRPVGGTAVMRGQLEHLIEVLALDTVTLQVLPTDVGAHPGISGAFTVLSFDGLGEPDIGYVEHPMGAVHIEKGEDVARARVVFDHLRSVALSPADSVALIERAVAQL